MGINLPEEDLLRFFKKMDLYLSDNGGVRVALSCGVLFYKVSAGSDF